MSPLVAYPDSSLVLPPRLFGSVAYYAAMGRFGRVTVDTSVRYDKRAKSVHRYDVADTRGLLSLTVPLGKPRSFRSATWADAPVSTHDQWWHQHRVTLESAYGRTPYFEFIYDRFAPLISDPSQQPEWPSALSLARDADRLVRGVLGFDNQVVWAPAEPSETSIDLRRADFKVSGLPPYRQIRADRLDFIPDLSILDLIFNLGPEAAFYLRDIGPAIDTQLINASAQSEIP